MLASVSLPLPRKDLNAARNPSWSDSNIAGEKLLATRLRRTEFKIGG
jgi:hypothetical protein